MFGLILGCGAVAAVGWLIGERRGRARAGAWLGALLGPVGWLLTLVLPCSVEAEAHRQLAREERAAAKQRALESRQRAGDTRG